MPFGMKLSLSHFGNQWNQPMAHFSFYSLRWRFLQLVFGFHRQDMRVASLGVGQGWHRLLI